MSPIPATTALSNAAVTVVAGPGIYTHEFAHYLACRVLGLAVEQRPTVFPLTADPVLEHEPAESFGADLLVAVAPFLLNSVLALGSFALAGAASAPVAVVFVWLGVTFGFTALPSETDTDTLLPGVKTLPELLRPAGYALAVPVRAATVSVGVAGVLTFVWTAMLYGFSP